MLDAADQLESEGISVRVIDMHTIKPVDKEAIIKAVDETGSIMTVEDHNVTGGFGSAVAEVIAEYGKGVRFRRLGLGSFQRDMGHIHRLKNRMVLASGQFVIW